MRRFILSMDKVHSLEDIIGIICATRYIKGYPANFEKYSNLVLHSSIPDLIDALSNEFDFQLNNKIVSDKEILKLLEDRMIVSFKDSCDKYIKELEDKYKNEEN